MVSRVIPVAPFDLVLFGATGDLARRKILPALFHRFQIGQFGNDCRIIGTSRTELSGEEFRSQTAEAIRDFGQDVETTAEEIAEFTQLLDYVAVDARGTGGWDQINEKLRDDAVRAFYLSVGPSLFPDIARRLSETGIATPESRIVLEKPFGHDLASAQELNAALRAHFQEKQIYRIDHYLGKETVQNLMALRFANSLFEPLWNSSHIDHVQITVAESIGVEGRGEYYDKSGAMRDMVQNHLMQLLCLTAMEPPARFTPNAVRDEKVKVIEALRPVPQTSIARGQYRGRSDGGAGDGYRDHAGNPASRTESYIALKAEVANWRWAGTPFYLRTGKRLRERVSEIAVFFRDPPHNIFEGSGPVHGNVLVIRLQPDEGITLRTTIKDPGPGGMRLTGANLDMTFAEELPESGRPQDAYERLIMDVIRGNQTLFMRGDEVEAAWAWADPIIAGWEEGGEAPQPYDSGSAGPDDSLLLIHRDGRRWRGIGS
ncbi:glucose-6-phosphate dehydrogenase [Nocardioides marinus]|jgi:glucose-6-phosphate 1-dehydrogenase|uniref:glucose-6-phosphate dehydrogenase n=1 Tax=Leisingera sp. TaxID=1879318 RepID=UPI001C944D0B|nr:glucose-6-phosphate dehydrogenase [Nocardioides marinus]